MGSANVAALLDLIQRVVLNHPSFFQTVGAGQGNKNSHTFVKAVKAEVSATFGEKCVIEKNIPGTKSAADYYFPEDKTIVEVARLMKNPNSEFHKDILKALLAKDSFEVDYLVFFGGPGSVASCQNPARKAFIDWAEAKHGLRIEVYDIQNLDKTALPLIGESEE